jgi:hypothetical protein
MPPRDPDTRRGRNPEPEWDESDTDDDYSEAYDDLTGNANDVLPDWSGQDQAAYPQSQTQGRSRSQPTFEPQAAPPPRRRSTAPLPELLKNLQRQEPPLTEPRRSTARSGQVRPPAQYAEPVEEEWTSEESWEAEPASYGDEYLDEYDYPPQPRRRSRGGGRARSRQRPTPRPPAMPPALAAALAAQDRGSLYLLAASAVSIFFMSLMLASRIGDLPETIPIHLDAAGVPDLWGTASTLWRIPLAAVMITLINAITAWFLSPRDPFIGRFLVGSSLLAQVLAWIALFLLLW